MGASKKSIKIGVIAEENNDVEVLYEYTSKLVDENRFSFNRFVGHGCGALRKKCRIWAENLVKRGCSGIVVIHDLDRATEAELRRDLEGQVKPIGAKFWVVLIPIEEIEAWLLSDPQAIASVFNMRKPPKVPKYPETIASPKEFLGKIVSRGSKASYINTIHNRKIAAAQSIETLERCPSFNRYPKFVSTIF